MISDKRNSIEIKHSELIEINLRLHNLINSLSGAEPVKENDLNVVCGFFMTKTMKTHMSVIELCKMGHGEDARSLIRTIYESMISLKYIIKYELAERYLAWDVVVRAAMISPYKNTKLGHELEKKLNLHGETTQGIIDRSIKNQEKYGYKNNTWSQKNMYDMSLAVGEEKTYRTVFKMQSQNIHSAPRLMQNYMKRIEGTISFDPSPSDNDIRSALIESFDFTSTVLKQYISITKQLDDQLLVNLRLEFEELLKKINFNEN